MNKEDYEREYLEITDREIARRELIEAGRGGALRDGYAAVELLTALLGQPGAVFNDVRDVYGDEIRRKYQGLSNGCDKNDLRRLVPAAVQVIAKLQERESRERIGVAGESDVAAWLRTLDGLEAKLVSMSAIS